MAKTHSSFLESISKNLLPTQIDTTKKDGKYFYFKISKVADIEFSQCIPRDPSVVQFYVINF